MTENNVNIDFIGIMNLLRYLLAEGHITEEERSCISARIAYNTGANIIVLNR